MVDLSSMDDEWLAVFDSNAHRMLADHQKSCWSKEGFFERLNLFKKLFLSLDSVSSALDVGCGYGDYCSFLAGKGLSVTGVDFSPSVIEKVKEKFPSVSFLVGNGYNLVFDDSSFDLVFSIGALQCLHDEKKFISELTRVSKKYVIISTLRRNRIVSSPLKELEKQLVRDSWPTRSFHPTEIVSLFEEFGFSCDVVLKNSKNEILSDCFFIVAKKN